MKKTGCKPHEGLIGKRCVDINKQLESSIAIAEKSKDAWGVEPPAVKILNDKVYVLDEASFVIYGPLRSHRIRSTRDEIYHKVGVNKSKDPIYGYYMLMQVTPGNLLKIKKKGFI